MIKEVIMPKLGETMEEGYLASWKKEEGEKVTKGEVLFEVMSDKTNFEVESLHDGYLRKKLVNPSEDAIKVTSVIGYISDNPDEPLPQASAGVKGGPEEEKPATPVISPAVPKEPESPAIRAEEAGTRIKASPLARKTAEDEGIDISMVRGTGPGGRIEKKDVLAHRDPAIPVTVRKDPAAGEFETIPWTPLRKIISRRLTESKREIPHYYFQGSLLIDRISEIKDLSRRRGLDFTYTDFLIFLVSRAMKKYPLINGALEDGQVKVYGSVDIGLAVSSGEGLLVPVMRDCAAKGIAQLSAERREIVDKARNNRLSEKESRGARFVISNLGMYGVENFQPIINPPGLAIMGVGSISRQPVVEGERIGIRQVMKVSFSFDHRVIDGSYAGLFYAYFKSIVENPSLLLFPMDNPDNA